MSRPIKFRVWESEYEGQMHYSDQKHADFRDEGGRCSWHITRDGIHIELWVYSRGPNNPKEMHKVVPKHEVMQYTGLKDPEGKELYEDDIVQYVESVSDEGGNYQLTSRGVIEWDEERAAFIISWRTGGEEYDAIFMDDNRQVVRIGNIHEHPDLL